MLAAERKARGWNQDDLSAATRTDPLKPRSGVSKRTISDIETGRELESRSADRVAAVLGWEPGSVASVLNGGEPSRGASARPEVTLRQALMGELAAATEEELSLVAQLLRQVRRQ